MRLLAASTLLLLANSQLSAFDLVPPAPTPARLSKAAAPERPLSDLVTLFNPSPAPVSGRFERPDEDPPVPASSKDQSRVVSSETICDALVSAAAAHDIPPVFFLRLIWQESRFDPLAMSHAGAQGVAQFMPRVAAAMGLVDPFDPEQALPMSARFLRELRRQFGNLGLAAAAYNAGSGRIQAWLAKKGKLPQETRDYVTKITGFSPEHWRKVAPSNVEFSVPRRAPCQLPESAVASIGNVPMPPPRPHDLQSQEPAESVEAAAKPQPVRVAAAGPVQMPLARPAPAPVARVEKRETVEKREAEKATARTEKREETVRVTGRGNRVEITRVASAGKARFESLIPIKQAATAPAAARGKAQVAKQVAKAQPAKVQPTESWGVQLAAHFSESKALAGFEEVKKKHASILANKNPIVVGAKASPKGATLKRVQIAMNNRASAEQLCSKLRGAGGACIVLASR